MYKANFYIHLLLLSSSLLSAYLLATTHQDSIDEQAIANLWDNRAEEWNQHMGDNGNLDPNRVFQSDPVLWNMVKEVKGLTVLDLGCGEGYIARKLLEKDAHVIAVDISEKMIEIAKKKSPSSIDYRLESSHKLTSIPTASIDCVVSNYVLMDVPNLDETVQEIFRVLKPQGKAVLIFSHPCFPFCAVESKPGLVISYGWQAPYFKNHVINCPGKSKFRKVQFSENLKIFHRPLSTYWKTFKQAGFEIIDLEEPLYSEKDTDKINPEHIPIFLAKPYSIAFLLGKPKIYG